MTEFRPVRDCAACLHVTEALPGAPLICTMQAIYRRVELVRAVHGLCGANGLMWRARHGSK